MKSTRRMSGDERREAIVRAARTLFAEKGFDGATTRDLANAAGVSEALLYKHFPSKDSLYAAARCTGRRSAEEIVIDRLMAMPSSTATLVQLVHFLVARSVHGCPNGSDEKETNCLMMRSLLENGDFTRSFLENFSCKWIAKFEECAAVAIQAGDMERSPVLTNLGAWFTHHVATMIRLHSIPSVPVIDYRVASDDLIDQAVWFTLRGAGLTTEAIERCYAPEKLQQLFM